MFDTFLARQGKERGERPQLEKLEDRDVPAVIGGVVYDDANCNGLFDAGSETGIANNTVQLYDSTNRLIATTVTDSTGHYTFTTRQGPTPGPADLTYSVDFPEARTNKSRTGSVPKFDSSLGTLTSIELIAEGNVKSNVMMENLEETPVEMQAELHATMRFKVGSKTLSDTPEQTISETLAAFDGNADFDGDSAHDFGTTELTGSFNSVVITNPTEMQAFISSTGSGTVAVSEQTSATSCACGSGNLLAMIRSTTEGHVRVVYHYQPNNTLGPGNYKIVQVRTPTGYVDGFETKDNVTKIAGSNRTDFINVTVASRNDQLTSNNFGETRANSSVSGVVYHDVNRSTRYDAGDIPLANVLVYLTGTDMCGNAVSLQTRTSATGGYSFRGLVEGSYTVREVQPSSYLQGTNNFGNATNNSKPAVDTMSFDLARDFNAVNYNFGELLNGTPPPPPLTGGGGGKRYYTGNGNGFHW